MNERHNTLETEAEADREQARVVISYLDKVKREMEQLREEVDKKSASREFIELDKAIKGLHHALNVAINSHATRIDGVEHALQF